VLDKHGVDVRLGTKPKVETLLGFDEVVIATGVTPRTPPIEGIAAAQCLSYVQVLSGKAEAGRRVAIIGAGGIGYDIAEFLSSPTPGTEEHVAHFQAEWGVDPAIRAPGGLTPTPEAKAERRIVMLQRKPGRMGRALGVSTGWILRLMLAKRGVTQLSGVTYRKIDSEGLHVSVGSEERVVAADSIVICAGQESERALHRELDAAGIAAHLIGGARLAAELDAMRAIDEGMRLAYTF
jgi:2,4-dienoyl-CoA reductase (NADPH2)